jgi:hypothetical protein
MGYRRCEDCGSYCWLPGRQGGYCPYCAAELLPCAKPAPVIDIRPYIKRQATLSVQNKTATPGSAG